MKTYLNRQECTDWLCACVSYDQLGEMLSRWGDNFTADEKRRLKTACTNIKKAMTSVAERMGTEMQLKLKRSAQTYTMVMVPNSSYKEYQKKVEAEMKEEGSWCSTELLCLLADKALQQCCCPCKESAEERELCPLRSAFINLDIPPFTEDPGPGGCPYEIK